MQLTMLKAAKLEAISMDEEIAFREVLGWLKFGRLVILPIIGHLEAL